MSVIVKNNPAKTTGRIAARRATGAAYVLHPEYTPWERLFDGAVHAIGVLAAIVAVMVLLGIVIAHGNAVTILAAAIYSVGMLAMFGFSAAYNLAGWGKWKDALHRCDHAAIYVMIAGTYTPFALIGIGGAGGYRMLALVWTVAIVSLVLKLLWPRRFRRVSLVSYLFLGWIGLAAAGSILAALPVPTLALLLAGGVLYTTGVVFHVWRSLAYQNAIWHGFVLSAAGCHYVAVVMSVTGA